MKKILLSILLLIFFHALLDAQTDIKTPEFIEEFIEELSAENESETDFSTIMDDLEYFYNNPIDLNKVTEEELNRLHFLSQIQINNILDYREKFGELYSIYELQLIEGLSNKDINNLIPFITISDIKDKNYSVKQILTYGRHQLFLRTQFLLENQKGYNKPTTEELKENPDLNRYLGNKYKYYAKYKYYFKNKVYWGFTMEKDQGEEFFAGNQKRGFDFYSAHLQINDIWKIKRLVVGDFHIQMGQGLIMWSGRDMGKSAYAMKINKLDQGLKRYSSVDENRFLRGGGLTFKLGKFELTGFYSQKDIDASLTDLDENTDNILISSIQKTGYHRTPSEIKGKHTIQEILLGSNIKFRHNNLLAGINYVNRILDKPIENDKVLYQKNNFYGTQNSNISLDYQYIFKEIIFFGEIAASENGGYAYLNGALFPLAPFFSLSILNRNYKPEFQSVYGSAFVENSSVQNEKGLYLGAEIYPIKSWKITAYFDRFEFPWLRYRVNAPSVGYETMLQIDYNPSRNVSLYLRWKKQEKEQNNRTEEQNASEIALYSSETYRFHSVYKLTNYLSLKSRIEYSIYKKLNEIKTGFLLYQDVILKPQLLPVSISMRYALFDAPYDARIYAYENDILYGFSVPGYFYKGYRTYFNIAYHATPNISFWFRIARFQYVDRDILSEGSLNEINGNSRTEIKLQMRIRL